MSPNAWFSNETYRSVVSRSCDVLSNVAEKATTREGDNRFGKCFVLLMLPYHPKHYQTPTNYTYYVIRSYSLSTRNHAELQKLSNWPLPTVHCWQSTMHCPTEQNEERFSCFQETSGRKVTRGINDFNEQLSSNLLRFLYCLNRGSTLLEINNGDGEPWGLMLVSGTLFTVCVNCGFQRANREGEQGVCSGLERLLQNVTLSLMQEMKFVLLCAYQCF